MSVWDSIIGQQPTVDLLSRLAGTPQPWECGGKESLHSGGKDISDQGISQGGSEGGSGDSFKGNAGESAGGTLRGGRIAQSWLICGAPGSGRSRVARAFAAALECPRHGCGECAVCRQVMRDEHPDVTVLATDRVTISIDEVRKLVADSEQMPSTTPWRIIIIEDVDRMLERTTNVLLKEVEEPAERTIWLLCAPSSEDVLPTIRSRTRIVNLAVPQAAAVAKFLRSTAGADEALAKRCARLAQGHIGIARLYATDDQALADRDKIVVGVLGMRRASDAVLLASSMVDSAQGQAKTGVDRAVTQEEANFREINGLAPGDKIPAALRPAFNAIGKKEDIRRRTVRLSRDVLDRFLNTIASVYRDISVLQNNAEDTAGIVNLENRTAIADMSARISRARTVANLHAIDSARRRLLHNGSQQLVLESLLASLVVY